MVLGRFSSFLTLVSINEFFQDCSVILLDFIDGERLVAEL